MTTFPRLRPSSSIRPLPGRRDRLACAFLALVVLCTGLMPGLRAGAAAAETEIHWGGKAEVAYDTGFAQRLRTHPEGGVCLFNMELVENDAPGAGESEKGVSADVVWGANRARKILDLDDARTYKAFIVIFTHSEKPPHPLTFTINGHHGQITKDNHETYRWAEFPADALRQGENVIELACPEATSEEDGWSLYLARADEFEHGGGDPADVGKTSFKSTDGGATWRESPFGPDGATRAEYSVRLSLDRHVPTGALETPVIDLWRGGSGELIVPIRQVLEATVRIDAEVPEGAAVHYFLRRGTSPSPYSDAWDPYEPVGDGPVLDVTLDVETRNRRFLQVKAVLTTTNPLISPIIHTVDVAATVQDTADPLDNLFVRESENPVILYPSVDWEWESWDRPEFEELRRRENLDELVAGARTQFQAQVRLMDHATKRWHGGGPLPEYPGWDALSILDRIDKTGSGGMCIQANNLLAGMCMAYGWQARLVNITAHETCEAWNDDYGKWIYLDGYYVNHYCYDKQSGEPLSILDLHRRFMDQYYSDRPIDWMKDDTRGPRSTKEGPVGLSVGGPYRASHDGYSLSVFARMVPRNNWYEKPYPRPLSHGCVWWPWDGYVNWYDGRTPPKRQYSWHTDRPQDMWPDLNKVHIHLTSASGNDRLYARFETYTPSFSHFEVNVDGRGWQEVDERWMWLLQHGQNTLKARAVSKSGVGGKPSKVVLNRVNPP